jgi:hypothetical protein
MDVSEWDRRLSIKCSVMDDGSWTRVISKEGLLRAGSFFRLDRKESLSIYEKTRKIFEKNWRLCFEDAGFLESDIRSFDAAFLKGRV